MADPYAIILRVIVGLHENIAVIEESKMQKSKKGFKILKGSHLVAVGISLLILLAVFLLWFYNLNSMQSNPALMGQVRFEGEYRVGENGEWHEIVEGEHIPATKGDVTLRGNFRVLTPFGDDAGVYSGDPPIAFYINHINLTIYADAEEPYILEREDPAYAKPVCGIGWEACSFVCDENDPVEIVIHNPHSFGNETAIDEMLSKLTFWTDMGLESEVSMAGETQRNAGIALILVSLMFLGTALFATLIHLKNSKIIWLLGLLVMCAGLYFAFSADGVSSWSESIVTNTTILGFSMMFYMLFVLTIIVCMLKKMKIVGMVTTTVLAVANAIFFVLPVISDILFYDTWIFWIAVQTVANFVLAVCLTVEFFLSKTKIRWLYIGAFLPLIAFYVDTLGNRFGSWRGGIVSQYVFIVLFIIAVVMVLKLIPQNINAAAKAKELEMEKIVLNAELTQSRISTMMSQIRPHFIYNTLGTIEQLCDIDPKKAGTLVHDFAKYLRGNFGELDNPKPISMSKEMEHVHHYVSIENVRFPDMTFTFEMNSEDFQIPALTIQPIVENAIKHGLMKLQKGGTINVVSYETETDYCVSVVDDGAGFDTTLLLDERKHVGLRNIRERLKAMVNGTLEIESAVGEGTKVLIKIPKEAKK